MLLKMIPKRFLASAFACALIFVTSGCSTAATQDAQVATAPAVQPAQADPQQLQQLVAPIALYPDELVAEVLAASTYPTEVVQANRWLQQNSTLKDQQLATEVDKQPWDASVKALTEFPSVLANMDKNLSWTSSLGDAYVNQQQDVMEAIQVLRDRAKQAGNLNTTSQQNVIQQGPTIVIEPADPQVVYVPEYDPWLVYGEPIGTWPGWYRYPGLYLAGPGIAFGFGFGIGFFGGFGWGWHHWRYDWHHHGIIFHNHGYVSHSRIFANRSTLYNGRGNFNRGTRGFQSRSPSGSSAFRGPATPRQGFTGPQHGFGSLHGAPGTHSGAFGGFNHGGVARGFSSRGQSSLGGGGGFHGGGNSHGGGGHR